MSYWIKDPNFIIRLDSILVVGHNDKATDGLEKAVTLFVGGGEGDHWKMWCESKERARDLANGIQALIEYEADGTAWREVGLSVFQGKSIFTTDYLTEIGGNVPAHAR